MATGIGVGVVGAGSALASLRTAFAADFNITTYPVPFVATSGEIGSLWVQYDQQFDVSGSATNIVAQFLNDTQQVVAAFKFTHNPNPGVWSADIPIMWADGISLNINVIATNGDGVQITAQNSALVVTQQPTPDDCYQSMLDCTICCHQNNNTIGCAHCCTECRTMCNNNVDCNGSVLLDTTDCTQLPTGGSCWEYPIPPTEQRTVKHN